MKGDDGQEKEYIAVGINGIVYDKQSLEFDKDDYFENIDDALIKGFEENQDFFNLLLGNDIKKKMIGIFTDEIYQSLRVSE